MRLGGGLGVTGRDKPIALGARTVYFASMIHRIAAFALFVTLYSVPVMACGPPLQATYTSDDQFIRAAKAQINRSDAIVDGVVWRRGNGQVFLRPIKVWKGERRRSYRILNDGCGVFVPQGGEKVRVLLGRDGPDWFIFEPVVYRRRGSPDFDAVLDRHLRNRRPTQFRSIGPIFPPLP